MRKDYRKQLTFQSGEISPRLFGRSDTEVYGEGLEIAENVVVDKRGGIFKRGGLKHQARTPGNDARVFTLQVSRQKFYSIVIRDAEMIIIAPGAKFLGSNLLLNPSFTDGGDNWDTTLIPGSSRVVFTSGEAQLLPETNNPQLVSEPGFNQGGAAWSVREIPAASVVTFVNNTAVLTPRQIAVGDIAGVFQQLLTPEPGIVHNMTLIGAFTGNILRVQVGVAEDDGTYFDEQVGSTTNEITLNFIPLASPFTITLDCEFPSTQIVLESVTVNAIITKSSSIAQEATVTALPTDEHLVNVAQLRNNRLNVSIGTTIGDNDIAEIISTSSEIALEFVPNNPTYWVTVRANGAFTPDGAIITHVATAAEEDAGGVGFAMSAPWTEDQLHEIHLAESPEGETLYFMHPNVPPQQLVYDFGTDTFIPLDECDFVEPPEQWVDTNWPSTGTHYQGRFWLGGAPVDGRQTVWASVSGSPLDFTKASGEASGSLEFILQKLGKIEWMLGTKTLMIGTENGEHIISSEGPIIIETDFKIDQQSSYGSNNMQGLQVAEKVFYATPDGRQLRSMAYEWREDNWLSQDLTYVSEHITIGRIAHSAWVQHPESLFLLVMEDGSIVTMTFDRTAETIGWTRYITPGFFAHDVAVGRIDGRSSLVAVGRRVPGQIDFSTVDFNPQKLDSYVEKFHGFGGTLIDGLDHLEGQEVRALVDGAVDPPQIVVGGQINTTVPGLQLYAGIAYTSKIKTLPPDVPDDQIRSWLKRWNKVWALLLNSNAPIINGVRPPDRTPATPMNTVEPKKTGHFVTVSLGWDDAGQITIEEPLPVDMNVLAIYGEMGAETL